MTGEGIGGSKKTNNEGLLILRILIRRYLVEATKYRSAARFGKIAGNFADQRSFFSSKI